MELRLKRLDFERNSYRARLEEEPNPFERVARLPNHGSLMRLCFHTEGLARLSGEQAMARDELAAEYRRKAVVISSTLGDPPPQWGEPLAFTIERWSSETGTVWLTQGDTRIQFGHCCPN